MVVRGKPAIYYRKIRYPRIELKTGELRLILPYGTSAHEIIKKHYAWISRKEKLIRKHLRASNNRKIINRSNNEFRNLIPKTANVFSKELNVKINNIYYRKMRTKWASCSSKQNLTINTMMRHLPKRQIEYILYHELVHMIEKKHNDRFWECISKKFKNHRKMEMSLFSYWFLLNSSKIAGI
ncbi:MAG: M48 family metallopeptidase [bacterium]